MKIKGLKQVLEKTVPGTGRRDMNIKCMKPWTTLHLEDNQIKTCCWSKQVLAELRDDTTLADFWNNATAQYLREKMLKGVTDDICPSTCPVLNLGSDNFAHFQKYKTGFWENEKKIFRHIKNGDLSLDSKPFDLSVVIDRVCNLRCIMCFIFDRLDIVVRDGFYRLVDETSASLRQVYFAGGEPFYSKRTLDFINVCIQKDYRFRFGFVTNLTILKKELLKKIRLDSVVTSIDGVTKETYEKIRRGANWEKVMHNLNALIKLRGEHRDKFVIKVAFVVMVSNFREIPKAIELFESLGVDLEFIPILQKKDHPENIYEKEEYFDEFMHIIQLSREKTSQSRISSSLNTLENILIERIAYNLLSSKN